MIRWFNWSQKMDEFVRISFFFSKTHWNLDVCVQFQILIALIAVSRFYLCKIKFVLFFLYFVSEKVIAILHFIHVADACGFIRPNALQTVESLYTLIKFALAISTSVLASKLDGRKMEMLETWKPLTESKNKNKNNQPEYRERKKRNMPAMSFATINLN